MALDPTRKQRLRAQLVGKTLHDVPTPSVVLDLAKVTTNCERMLEATKRLGLLWRAHVKTHKTLELTRLQVGDTGPVSLIGSTVTDVENLLPLVKEYQSSNRRANVLLGFPLFPSAVPRLRTFLSQAGPGSLSVLIDNPAQLASVSALAFGLSPVPIFLKIDAGYGRAGVVPSSPACAELIDAALAAETSGDAILHGIYCHAGHSYALRETWSAMDYLADEFGGLAGVAKLIRSKSPGHDLVLSVGATPTATAIQHPLFSSSGGKDGGTDAPATATTVQNQLAELKAEGFQLEVHAGVYPTLDLQQLATHARDASLMTADDIAISVLAEVASVYPSRGKASTTEALIAAGSLTLGREPVSDQGAVPGRDYSGWGILKPWGAAAGNPPPGPDFPRVHGGWQVGRISQEHGVLVWNGDAPEKQIPLAVGDKVRVWPNHSCIAGACFGHYVIVDSRNDNGREDEVVDVWPRWPGGNILP